MGRAMREAHPQGLPRVHGKQDVGHDFDAPLRKAPRRRGSARQNHERPAMWLTLSTRNCELVCNVQGCQTFIIYVAASSRHACLQTCQL